MNTTKVEHGQTKMVAHRGVSGLEKENTCAAFVAAGSRSYWGIETDVHRTADKNFVVIHDEDAQRVSGESLNVEENTLETIQQLRLNDVDGSKDRADLRIPTLEEYVKICKKYEKIGVLELKSEFTDEEMARMLEVIRGLDYLEGIVFISFSYANLQRVRAIVPEQPCQFLTGNFDDELLARLKADKIDLDIHFSFLTEERIQKLHENGIVINTWAVNNPADAKRLIDWGVDQITSDILE